ncbi:FxLYD domain-containing protein [Natronococcus sp.]|uniref:FxLYD domain-containing protein n=1 Tax=Natronococcus sp. TaxID=35747 RepID=UPI0025E31375|nr:FxLYD domain-containing protein [Natronococcus sp.]
MYRRAFLAVAASLSVSGCLEYFTEDAEEITEPADVEIVWDDLVRDDPGTEDERVYVWGVVRNAGERTLSYVELRVTFFDDEGEELESVIENVEENVAEGEEWPFDAEFPHFGEEAAEVDSYELEPATGV